MTESACFVNSHTCTAEQMKYNGEYFFSMSEFGIAKIDCIEPEGTWFPLYVNDAMALVTNAERMLELSVSVAQFNTCIKEVQQMIELLGRALNTPLPVEFTTEQDPTVFYRIIAVSGNSPLEYEDVETPNMFDDYGAPLNLVAFADSDENRLGQAWYFVRGSDVGRYYICPLQGDGRVLGTNPEWNQVMQAGKGRVWGVEKDDAGCVTEWNITLLESGECLFSPVYATTLVLGREDIYSQKLGFVSDSSTENARFVIEKTELNYAGVEQSVTAEDDDAAVVYDIYGRRVVRVTLPGFYIVDGRKVYIRP